VVREESLAINTTALQPRFYRRLRIREATNRIGIAMMKLPRVRSEAKKRNCSVRLSK